MNELYIIVCYISLTIIHYSDVVQLVLLLMGTHLTLEWIIMAMISAARVKSTWQTLLLHAPETAHVTPFRIIMSQLRASWRLILGSQLTSTLWAVVTTRKTKQHGGCCMILQEGPGNTTKGKQRNLLNLCSRLVVRNPPERSHQGGVYR